MPTIVKVAIGATPVMVVLVAAAFLTPPVTPLLLRQVLLCAWAIVGTTAAERVLFGTGFDRMGAELGVVRARRPAVLVALIVSLPMWVTLPIYAQMAGVSVVLAPGWPAILLGVILVNGIAEEVIHRAFVFGHLRRTYGFFHAAGLSAALFALQHLYLVALIGTVAGLASVVLAVALAFPLALVYERGGNSLVAPALLHISANAPIMLLVAETDAARFILPHMAVVLVSIYLSFPLLRWLDPRG